MILVTGIIVLVAIFITLIINNFNSSVLIEGLNKSDENKETQLETSVSPGMPSLIERETDTENVKININSPIMITPEFVKSQNTTKEEIVFDQEVLEKVLAQNKIIPYNIVLGNGNLSIHEYSKIGMNFLSITSEVRNIPLPNVISDDYIVLGQLVSRLIYRKKKGVTGNSITTLKTVLIKKVNTILSSSENNTSIGNSCSVYTDNNKKDSNYMDERGEGNKSVASGMVGMIGKYNKSYKPTDDTKYPRPYDSVWQFIN